MPSAKIGDIDIYYEEQGQGEPVLLAPPSWWPSDTWKVSVVPFLSKHYRTIIFDCRGTGYCSKPDHGYNIEQFAKDCAGLLGYLKVSRCHAAGFALGGQIAQALAIQRPDLVATLTIAAAGAGTKATDGGPRVIRNTDEEEIREHGFERFIRGHVENTHMAFNADLLRCPSGSGQSAFGCVVAASDESGATSISLRGPTHLGYIRQRGESKSADADTLRRAGRRQSRRQYACRHGAQTRRIGSRQRACARA